MDSLVLDGARWRNVEVGLHGRYDAGRARDAARKHSFRLCPPRLAPTLCALRLGSGEQHEAPMETAVAGETAWHRHEPMPSSDAA